MDHGSPELSPAPGEASVSVGASRRNLIGFALVVVVGFVGLAARRSPAIPFKGSFSSERALAQSVLDRFQNRDLLDLRELALDRREFESRIWPEMPSRGWVDVEFAWSGLHDKSQRALERNLRRYGGQRLTPARRPLPRRDHSLLQLHRIGGRRSSGSETPTAARGGSPCSALCSNTTGASGSSAT